MKVRRDGILETQPVSIVERPGVVPVAEKKASTSLTSAGSAVLQNAAIPTGKTGKLQSVTVSAEVAWQATVQKFDGSVTSDIVVLHGLPGIPFTYRPANPDAALHSVASAGTSRFQVAVVNNNPTYSTILALIYVTTEWDEKET
ncbi:MAG: hypothetical protein ABIW84_00320 [Ilumatobacteraceae bacterium]